MIVRAAVCPGAPLLVPGLAPSLADSVRDLVDSCAQAVGALADLDRVVLLTSGPRLRDAGRAAPPAIVLHGPGTSVTSAILTQSRLPGDFHVRLAGSERDVPGVEAPGVGVGVLVGVALATAAGIIDITAIELGGDSAGSWATPGSPVRRVLAVAEQQAERVGLLVVGEGSASRGSSSPGGGWSGAQEFDDSVAAALRAGDPAMLGKVVDVDPGTATRLAFTSGPSLGVLAAIAGDEPPHHCELLYAGAPVGVGYFVATWSWG